MYLGQVFQKGIVFTKLVIDLLLHSLGALDEYSVMHHLMLKGLPIVSGQLIVAVVSITA